MKRLFDYLLTYSNWHNNLAVWSDTAWCVECGSKIYTRRQEPTEKFAGFPVGQIETGHDLHKLYGYTDTRRPQASTPNGMGMGEW